MKFYEFNKMQILSTMGYSWPVRKIASAMSITLCIDDTDRDRGVTTEFRTILKSTKMELSLDHAVSERGLTSSELYTVSPITMSHFGFDFIFGF